MRKYLAGLLLTSSFFLASSALSHAADTRIAVVDIQKLEIESETGLATRDAFSKEVEARSKVISSREESFRLLEAEYLKTREGLTPQQRADREERLSKESRDIKRLRDDTSEELQKKGMELRSKNLNQILVIIKRAAEDGKYTIVLDKRQALYTLDTIDLTQKVMDMYNTLAKTSGK